MSGFCTTNYQEICHAFWLEVRKGCFIFECTVLDLNCDRLRDSQFSILCSYWSTLKLLPVLIFRGKRPYIESTHTLYPLPNWPCSTCLQLWQSSLVCGSVNLTRMHLLSCPFHIQLVCMSTTYVKIFFCFMLQVEWLLNNDLIIPNNSNLKMNIVL